MKNNVRFEIVVARDKQANVLYIERSTIPGLHLEADTFEEMQAAIIEVVPDLLAHNVTIESDTEVLVEVFKQTEPEQPYVRNMRDTIQPRFLVEHEMAVA